MNKSLATAALLAALTVAGARADGKLAAGGVIPAGYRGFSLPLSGTELAFVKKGDRVDVLVEFEGVLKTKGEDAKEKIVATILQNVIIVDMKRPEKLDQLGVVELMLNPNEAQYAALSEAQGAVHLSLRAEGETEMHPMEMASFRKLFR